MPLYVGDYLADTTHLTAGEDGAYMRLLMCMWRAGGSLPDDDVRLARFCKLTPAQWQRVKPAVMEFFTVSEGVITQRRLSKELQKHTAAVFQRREAGSRGGQAKALKDKETGLAGAMPSPCQPEPEPEPEKKVEASPLVAKATPPEFEEAWKAYPHVKGRSSKKLALAEWRKLPPLDRLRVPVACRRYAVEGREPKGDCGAPAMERWLKRGLHQEWWGDTSNVVSISPEWLAERARLAETAEAS